MGGNHGRVARAATDITLSTTDRTDPASHPLDQRSSTAMHAVIRPRAWPFLRSAAATDALGAPLACNENRTSAMA